MPEETKIPSVAPKAEALKKAGFSPWVTIVIIVLSTPGFYEFFFNKIGERANSKADIAYEVLKKEIESLRADDRVIEHEIGDIRQMIMMIGIRSSVEVPIPVTSPRATGGRSVGVSASPMSRGAVSAGAGSVAVPDAPISSTLLPPEVIRKMAEKDDPIRDRKSLPKLEDLVE